MPTYEYRCPKGHQFELMQKMNDRPRAKCPVCGLAAVRQISGGAGLIFKGSGFYITDYGKDGKGPRKERDTDSASPVTPPVTESTTKGDTSGPAEKSTSSEAAAKPDKATKPEKPPAASTSARKKSKP